MRMVRTTKPNVKMTSTGVKPIRTLVNRKSLPAAALDIRGRRFRVVVEAAPWTGALRRGEVIPWHRIASLIAPRERCGSR